MSNRVSRRCIDWDVSFSQTEPPSAAHRRSSFAIGLVHGSGFTGLKDGAVRRCHLLE